MATVITDDRHYKAIADTVREILISKENYKPSEMPNAINAVYAGGRADGYSEGRADGYAEGVAEGKQSEYNAFWDTFQKNGQRVNYDHAFSGDAAWTDGIFYPKHSMAPTSAANMFSKTGITDLKGQLEELDVTLDFSRCTNVANLFNSAVSVTRLPKMDFSSATSYASTFGWAAQLVSIDEVVFNKNATALTNMFAGCTRLTEVLFTGEIAANGLNLSACKNLSQYSIETLIFALSANTSGYAVTLSLTAVNNAFGGADSTWWANLIGIRKNWSIALIDDTNG